MNFVGYRQLHRDVAEYSATLPGDLAGVIGVPRSGLMVASLLALHRNEIALGCPSADDLLWLGHGPRRRGSLPPGGTILLLDDTVSSGGSLRRARERVEPQLGHGRRLLTGALYVTPQRQNAVDHCLAVVPHPRLFAWNWIGGRGRLRHALLDIDGVLCYDPPVFDDDSEAYQRAIREARPLHVPTVPVGGLATGRLERWRGLTEAWLGEHGIRYGRLAMYRAQTARQRRARRDVPEWKGRVLKKGPWKWMIESSKVQASRIARVARKPVICLQDERVYRS